MKLKDRLLSNRFSLFGIGLLLFAGTGLSLNAQVKPENLKCEYLTDPLGVDTYSPRFTWQLTDDRPGSSQLACRIQVGTNPGDLATGNADCWNTQKIVSGEMRLTYEGKKLLPFTKYYWQVEIWDKDNKHFASDIVSFETGMMEIHNWKGAWISDGHGAAGNSINVKEAPYFRKEFEMQKNIVSARAYIAVAGLYELYINGERVGDHRLDPMFTRFDRRNLYVTYDITKQLHKGENAIGVILGNGWYNHQSTAVWFFDRAPWRDRPAFCMDIRITYDDGSVETIITEKDWKTSFGAIIFNSIYTGEHYDARLEQSGWDTAGFDDSKWKEVIYRSAPSQNIVSQQLHPIRNLERLIPESVKKINETTWLFDFGKNIAGVSELHLNAPAGTEVRLKHGEILGKNGRIDMADIEAHYRPVDDNDPFQTDVFLLKGNGEETFMPRFNYKGFRYVEVSINKPVTLTADNLAAWFMHSDVPPAGTFETSNQIINKIWQAANNAYLSNLYGYPTDCPHREKNGWTNDANIAVEMGLYNFDVITIYEKWLADHRDIQQPNGVLPSIIPDSGWGYEWANGLDCTSTLLLVPWNVYLFYGDSRLLAECYDNMKRYINHVTDIAPSGLTSWGLGDWAVYKSSVPEEFVASIYYYNDVVIMKNTAKLFGKTEDEQKYEALAEKIKTTFNHKYLNVATGIYGDGKQTELSMPLHWGLVPEDLKDKVATNLAQRIKKNNNHIDVGIFGAKALFNALSDNGYAALAYELASQDTYPSWGWWIKNGATTLYESWEGKYSRNHIMFGEISAWFYKALAGIKIDTENPGFKNIRLQPQFVPGLDYVSATHQSPYGNIVSKWERKNKNIIYTVTIPANSSADLHLSSTEKIQKAQIASGNTVHLSKDENNICRLSAGSYRLEIEL
ncbi:MAG: glycoside hydrolase family 78 protein [Dysgonamonadaceae bacterium]|jgi:alpha-L-rhamnosidase|nr:glycoside hydrolase family 78 protein [Dysgonamonadaceae bacterium]